MREAAEFVQDRLSEERRGRQHHRDSERDEDDALDKLERLADLHEKGALSDEEFEAKKQELLDEICDSCNAVSLRNSVGRLGK